MLYSLQLIHYAFPPVHFGVFQYLKGLTGTLILNNLQSLTSSQRPLLSLRNTHSQLISAIYQSEDDRLVKEAQRKQGGALSLKEGVSTASNAPHKLLRVKKECAVIY